MALAVLAAGSAGWMILLPPPATQLAPVPGLPAPTRGAIHVHTTRSDGTGSVDAVAAAAARTGLSFVILTDHGDGTRAPDPPAYRRGVLIIDAVEISTDHGHVVALDLPPSDYPLGGEGRDVVEDIQRAGGFAIAAHPASPKPELRWAEWNASFGGIEWLNMDSEWRDERLVTRARVLLSYPVRPRESLAAILDRPAALLRRWDGLTAERPVVAVAAVDAHGGLSIRRSDEPSAGVASLPLPSYRHMLATLSLGIVGIELTGDAAVDARGVLGALRSGRVYSAVDGVAGPVAFAFSARSGAHRAEQGDRLPIDGDGPVSLSVASNAGPQASVVLFRNGEVLATVPGGTLNLDVEPVRAVYRAELRWQGAPGDPPVPWVLSNPIYVGAAESGTSLLGGNDAAEVLGRYRGGPAGAAQWTIETSADAAGAVDVSPAKGSEFLLRYALGGTAASSPYAAFVLPAGRDFRSATYLLFRARALRPMRLSVQLRAGGTGQERWQRSVFVDEAVREIAVRLDDMRPVGPTIPSTPALDRVDTVLFVVDTTNTAIGTNGRLWIDDIRYARPARVRSERSGAGR